MDNDSWYTKRGATPPQRTSHNLTADEIIEKLEPLKPTNWRLEGNKLIADTAMGPLINYISTDYIMTGVEDGLPVFKKV